MAAATRAGAARLIRVARDDRHRELCGLLRHRRRHHSAGIANLQCDRDGFRSGAPTHSETITVTVPLGSTRNLRNISGERKILRLLRRVAHEARRLRVPSPAALNYRRPRTLKSPAAGLRVFLRVLDHHGHGFLRSLGVHAVLHSEVVARRPRKSSPSGYGYGPPAFSVGNPSRSRTRCAFRRSAKHIALSFVTIMEFTANQFRKPSGTVTPWLSAHYDHCAHTHQTSQAGN